jgi:hypothetical protein
VADILTTLRQRNRLSTTLKSGLQIDYHLPDVKLCIVQAEELEDASELRRAWEAKTAMLEQMLDAVDGEEITERDDRRAIVAALTPDERDELDELAGPPLPVGVAQPGTVESWEEAGAQNQREWLEAANVSELRRAGTPTGSQPSG